jgi:tubulin-specific chaperone A
MDKNTARQLKIKTATLKRYSYTCLTMVLSRNQKDYNSYNNENKTLETKLEQIKESGDEVGIKKLQEQIQETAQMLPNSKTRIETAIEDLKNFMSEHEENEELKATEDWVTAEQTLAEVSAFVETI